MFFGQFYNNIIVIDGLFKITSQPEAELSNFYKYKMSIIIYDNTIVGKSILNIRVKMIKFIKLLHPCTKAEALRV